MLNLQTGEQVLYESKPEPSMLGYWFLSRIVSLALLILVCFGWLPIMFHYLDKQVPLLNYIIWGLITFLVLLFLYLIPLLKSHKYYITNKRVFAQAGVASKRERSIMFNKITDVTISQNIFERMFKISKLHIHTAGTSGRAEICFLGLGETNTPEKIISKHLKR